MRITRSGLVWQKPDFPTADKFMDRLGVVLRAWEGTPYMAGQQAKKVGVDCVRFVCSVLDEMYRLPRTATPRLPPDKAMHDRKGAIGVMRLIKRLYPHHIRVPIGQPVQPMDIIVVGHLTGGPGHAILVGNRPNTLWQAGTRGVHYTGLGLAGQWQHIFRIYRFTDRENL